MPTPPLGQRLPNRKTPLPTLNVFDKAWYDDTSQYGRYVYYAENWGANDKNI
jgi:hypothetical protein